MADSISRSGRLYVLIALLVPLVGLDQWSKHYAIAHWDGQPRQSYLGDTFRIEYAENTGAFLSLFGNLPDQWRYAILVVGNGIGMAVVVALILGVRQIDRWSFVAWTLVFSGGVGNLIDRVRIQAVIDFLNLGVGPLRTGIFNIADMAITAGFFMLLPQVFRSAPSQTSHTGPLADHNRSNPPPLPSPPAS